MRDVAHLVDAAAVGRIVVFGSLPPDCRDLDLLVRPEDAEAVAARLTEAGFVRRGREWVRFAECSAYAIDLVAADSWALPADELQALFAEARPIDGLARLARPAPHHELLILARIGMTPKRGRRLEAALAEDPDALVRAERSAAGWGADLSRLRPRRRLLPRPRPRPRRRRVVAFSGLDGSGKSSQTAALQEALAQLGHRAEVVWLPITANAAVWKISALARRVLPWVRWLPGARRLDRKVASGQSFLATPGETRRSGVLTRLWVTYIAAVNAVTHRRLARRADVVVFDRYVLDSVVRMHYLWAARFRPAAWLLRALSPKPAAAFFLDVPAEVALFRKQDQWSLEELQRQRELYREEAQRLGVTILDGTRPKEELCAEIAETVWRRLG